MKRFLKVIFLLLTLFLLIGILSTVFLKIRTVEVKGGSYYTDQQVKSVALPSHWSYHSVFFWIKTHFKTVPCLPFTQEVTVEWKNTSHIVLHVYDKTISGSVKYLGKYIFFDRKGIVLQSLSQPMAGVPVVTGIKMGQFTVGTKMQVKDDILFQTIMNLSQLIRHYKISIDTIHFDHRDVFLQAGGVTVELGEKDFYDDDMAALVSVLKQTRKKNLKGSIDMTRYTSGDNIILKKK